MYSQNDDDDVRFAIISLIVYSICSSFTSSLATNVTTPADPWREKYYQSLQHNEQLRLEHNELSDRNTNISREKYVTELNLQKARNLSQHIQDKHAEMLRLFTIKLIIDDVEYSRQHQLPPKCFKCHNFDHETKACNASKIPTDQKDLRIHIRQSIWNHFLSRAQNDTRMTKLRTALHTKYHQNHIKIVDTFDTFLAAFCHTLATVYEEISTDATSFSFYLENKTVFIKELRVSDVPGDDFMDILTSTFA